MTDPGVGSSPARPVANAVLRDGTPVIVRPIRPDDSEALRSGMEQLSEEARYRRFMTAKRSLSAKELADLAGPDGERHVAIGARDPARPGPDGSPEGLGIGTARYYRSSKDPTSAEFAVTVIDGYRMRGLATLLLDHLSAVAREHGIRQLTAEFLAENRAVEQLIIGRGGRVAVVPEDRSVKTAIIPLVQDHSEPTNGS